jgi:ABC-type transporter Mla subunit MlaD
MPFTFKSAQKAVAMFSLIGLFLFIAIFIMIGRGSDLFTFKDSYYTVLEEGYGLEQGMKIKFKNAIIVGRIKNLQLTPDNKVKAEIAIFSEYRNLIRQDSVLKVNTSLLGGSSLQLLPSIDPNAMALLPGSLILSSDMEKGQEIMVKLSEQGPKKEDLMGKVKEILDFIADLKPMINKTMMNVRDSTGSLKSILGGLKGDDKSEVSDKLLATLENVKMMSKNFKELSTELNSEDNTIGAVIKDKKALYKKIDTMMSSVDTSLKNVKNITEKLQDSPDDIKSIMVLLKENLIESKKVLIGMKNFFGGEKETDKTIKSGGRKK